MINKEHELCKALICSTGNSSSTRTFFRESSKKYTHMVETYLPKMSE